jgi:hypothetical protein
LASALVIYFALVRPHAPHRADTRPFAREPFIVKHYAATERPIIKGNGFDGLEVGQDREEAEEFVRWLNDALGVAAVCSDEAEERNKPDGENHA